VYKCKLNLAGIPEWGQQVWVHNDKGNKLEAHRLQANWVGHDSDSLHAHCIYWLDKCSISVERNIRFILDSVMVYTQSSSHKTNTTLGTSSAQLLSMHSTGTVPAACKPSEPTTRSSGEDPQQAEEPLPPSPSPPPLPLPCHQRSKLRAPPEGVQCSSWIPVPLDYVRHLTQGEGTINGHISNLKWMHPNVQEQLSSPDQSFCMAPDDTVVVGIEYAYQANFDDVIVAAIQDAQGDLKSLNEAQSCSDWPSCEKAMGSKINTLQHVGTWETIHAQQARTLSGANGFTGSSRRWTAPSTSTRCG
jgi:hypothetical protein